MALFELLAERKIAEAVSRGELDDLPGAGKPLALDDDALIPEDLRLAYRILKKAGFENSAEKEALLRKIALLRTARESRPARRRART
jgi:hypothetical protein